jgi:hypothetical protein
MNVNQVTSVNVNQLFNVEFEDLTMVFWVLMICHFGEIPTFQRNVLPSSSGSMDKPSKKQSTTKSAYCLFLAWIFL